MVKRKKPNNKQQNFFKKNYSLSWEYIKESKNYILLIVIVLFASALLAFIFQPTGIVKSITGFIKDLIEKTTGLNTREMINFIFLNNIKSSFISMITGVFLGIFPIFSAVINGYVLGFVSQKAIAVDGALSLWRLIPHGIFEFPAIIISMALGTKLGFTLIKNLKDFYNDRKISKVLKNILFFIIPIIFFIQLFLGLLIIKGSLTYLNPLQNSPTVLSLIAFLILAFSFLYFFVISFIIILIREDSRKEFLRRLKNSIIVFLFVILPLLIIAAIIEGFLFMAIK